MPFLPIDLLSVCICALVTLLYYSGKRILSRRISYLPGPRGNIFFGNVFQIPVKEPWKAFHKWSQTYGDAFAIRLLTRPTVILCSTQAAFELLEKRSHIYSDRLPSVMDELSSWSFNFGMMPYGPQWRTRRRMLYQYFHKGATKNYESVQQREILRFFQRVLGDSNNLNLEHEARKMITAVVVSTVYGIDTPDEEYVRMAEIAMHAFDEFRTPGAFWVEYLPILRYLPGWIPGVKFKKVAKYYKPYVESMIRKPFEVVRDAVNNGNAFPSIAESLLSKLRSEYGNSPEYFVQEEIARDTTAVGYSTAIDTTTSALLMFLVAMAFHPEVQEKAQKEIDDVIGPEQLASSEDRDRLPYIQALILETFRWKPVVPLITPHATVEDDEYKGYLIPKGSAVIANIWAMMHDPETYPEPERFNPDRFMKGQNLDTSILSPFSLAFGFGKRICPGRYFSDSLLFLSISSILKTFDIVLDPNFQGEDVGVAEGLISVPTSVPCILKPRSHVTEQLIRDLLN